MLTPSIGFFVQSQPQLYRLPVVPWFSDRFESFFTQPQVKGRCFFQIIREKKDINRSGIKNIQRSRRFMWFCTKLCGMKWFTFQSTHLSDLKCHGKIESTPLTKPHQKKTWILNPKNCTEVHVFPFEKKISNKRHLILVTIGKKPTETPWIWWTSETLTLYPKGSPEAFWALSLADGNCLSSNFGAWTLQNEGSNSMQKQGSFGF